MSAMGKAEGKNRKVKFVEVEKADEVSKLLLPRQCELQFCKTDIRRKLKGEKQISLSHFNVFAYEM